MGGRVPGLREKQPQAAVHKKGVHGAAKKSEQPHPNTGKPPPAHQSVQQPHGQAEQHAASHAQKHALHRIPAEKRGEKLVKGQHIGGGGLPHTGRPKHSPHGHGLQRPHQRPGHQHRNVGNGHGQGRDVHIAKSRKRHQQLNGHQRGPEIPVGAPFYLTRFFLHPCLTSSPFFQIFAGNNRCPLKLTTV